MFQPPFGVTKLPTSKRGTTSVPSKTTNTTTHFLALDKPGPDNEFLSLMEIAPPVPSTFLNCPKAYLQKLPTGKYALQYDEEWLAITRSFSDRLLVRHISNDRASSKEEEECIKNIPMNLQWVQENITAQDLLRVPENFKRHAPGLDPNQKVNASDQPQEYPNSQTEAFCSLLGVKNWLCIDEDQSKEGEWIVFG